MNKSIVMVLLLSSSLSYCLCCFKEAKPKPQIPHQKAQLMKLIEKSDVMGIRIFTQTGDVRYIDEQVWNLTEKKFEATGITSPPYASCNEFLVMVLVQSAAPIEVKQKFYSQK